MIALYCEIANDYDLTTKHYGRLLLKDQKYHIQIYNAYAGYFIRQHLYSHAEVCLNKALELSNKPNINTLNLKIVY